MCSGKRQAIKAVLCGRWTPARVRFATSLFHCLHMNGSKNAAKLGSAPRSEIAKSVAEFEINFFRASDIKCLLAREIFNLPEKK